MVYLLGGDEESPDRRSPLVNQDLSFLHKTQAESANYRETSTRNYDGLNKATPEVSHAS